MKTPVNDAEGYWLELYHRGDERALAYYFNLHYRSLCYFANKLIHDPDEAKDVVSGCFINFWNGEHKAESNQSIKSFLYISCKNACLNNLKQHDSRTKTQNDYYRQLAKEDNSIEYNIVQSEVLEILAREIDHLPEKCRAVFKMIYFEHKKTEEIATVLNFTEKSVRYYKAKAIELLKSSMLKRGLSDSLFVFILLILRKL